MHPAVFLDLEKTLIQDPAEAASGGGAQAVLIKGAAPAVASLRGLGYRIVVVANHDGVARGTQSEDDIAALHEAVAQQMRATANGAVIDAFYSCPYHPKGVVEQYAKDHANRKPKPGMLLEAAEQMSLDLPRSWTIGDELADIQAGHAAGTRTILLRPDADRLQPADPAKLAGVTHEKPGRERPAGPDFYAVGLVDAARLIAQQPRNEQADQGRRPGKRNWDTQKIAKLQVPRPVPEVDEPAQPKAPKPPGRAFRPWGAPVPESEDDHPIVAKPFRKRTSPRDKTEAEPASAPDAPPAATPGQETAQPSEPDASPRDEPAEPKPIPATIREAKRRKHDSKTQGDDDAPGSGEPSRLLRLILQELRSQRGQSQEFSFLTLVAVALQLVAVVCLLGGLFMGRGDDGLFLRWLGAGLMIQLMAIATLLYGR